MTFVTNEAGRQSHCHREHKRINSPQGVVPFRESKTVKNVIVMISALALAAGCASPVPVAQSFPATMQKVVRSAHHWDVVADDVVSQTFAAIATKPVLQNRGIYITPAKQTAFNTAFRDFLITRFVGRGADVSVCKVPETGKAGFVMDNKDVEIQYETQVIGHGEYPSNYIPGMATALYSGVMVLRHAARHNLSRLEQHALGLGVVGAFDWAYGYFPGATRTEIIVTTTIIEGNRFVMRNSDVYYVPDADAALYFQRVTASSTCPGEKVAEASSYQTDDVATEFARKRMIEQSMRRSNPQWRGFTDGFSSSYSAR